MYNFFFFLFSRKQKKKYKRIKKKKKNPLSRHGRLPNWVTRGLLEKIWSFQKWIQNTWLRGDYRRGGEGGGWRLRFMFLFCLFVGGSLICCCRRKNHVYTRTHSRPTGRKSAVFIQGVLLSSKPANYPYTEISIRFFLLSSWFARILCIVL